MTEHLHGRPTDGRTIGCNRAYEAKSNERSKPGSARANENLGLDDQNAVRNAVWISSSTSELLESEYGPGRAG